jgi:hypothetical protein
VDLTSTSPLGWAGTSIKIYQRTLHCPDGTSQSLCDNDNPDGTGVYEHLQPTEYSEKANWPVVFEATLQSCDEDKFVPCIIEDLDFGPSASSSYPVLHHSFFPCMPYLTNFYYAEMTAIRDPYPAQPEITFSMWKYYADTTATGVTNHHFMDEEGNVVLYGHKSDKNLGDDAVVGSADDEYDYVPYIFFGVQSGTLQGTPTVAPTYSVMPSPLPTPEPTLPPTPLPTLTPTYLPTNLPTPLPTLYPTYVPTYSPTPLPTPYPTDLPSFQPTPLPTMKPTSAPTPEPSFEPTGLPTLKPSPLPSGSPTHTPTPMPTVVCYSGFYVGDDPDGRAPQGQGKDEFFPGVNEEGPFCHSDPNNKEVCKGDPSYRMCSRCPLGRITNFTGPPYPSSCKLCPAGKIRETLTATFCKSCITGKFATPERLQCVQCNPGEYVNLTALACMGCSKGRYAPQAVEHQCLECAAGMYTKGEEFRATACSDCSPGLAAVAFSVNCTTCLAGQYSGTRAQYCLNCTVRFLTAVLFPFFHLALCTQHSSTQYHAN